MVLDNHHHGSSSQVAAGIINPVTGHRLNITEGFNSYYPVAKKYYSAFQQLGGEAVWRSVKQTRLIKNQGQSAYYQQRCEEAAYRDVLSSFQSKNPLFTDTPHGCVEIQQSAVVDTKAFLTEVKKRLLAHYSYAQAKIDHQHIVISEQGFEYSGYAAAQLIFCEGFQAINNPWLQELPFKLAKGEILTVSCKQALPDQLLNWGNWLVGNSDGQQARLGSSFVWNDLSLQASSKNANKLLQSLAQHTEIQAAHLKTEVGIRPTTQQRKPFIGAITALPGAYCFNGFGSKGCLLIPYYAELLCEHLLSGAPIPAELTQWL